MNIAEYSIKNKVISWLFLVILAIGGVTSFGNLSRLEDPAFTIKDAMIISTYPGATSMEVEEELTYPLEKEIRQLPYIDKITSTSSNGMSQIMVSMKMDYGPDELPQIWDEMRRKINDLQPTLPSGVNSVQIIDDFGDVFGVMIMLTGDGYDYVELKQYADYLTREIELVDGVGKVSIAGDQQEQLFVEMSLERLAALNLDMSTVTSLLAQQNSVVSAGEVMLNGQSLTIKPNGTLSTVEELENLIIHGRDTGNLIRLKDVAEVTRGIQEKPGNVLTYNGKPAINLGIAFSSGVNVVEIGKALDAELDRLESIKPAGVELNYFYNQAQEVDKSVADFLISLVEAVAIVIIVLLFAMGLRSGLIIGLVLLLTVFGTFILMDYNNVELHRISLGALIIALGMLVDNAIVVVEGILVGLKKGKTKLQAAKDIVSQTQWPLLGATIIAITAFAPIGLSKDATGEFMGSLFWVLCFSLFLSWVTALTLTPFLAEMMLKEEDKVDENEDPYKGILFVVFGASLKFALRFRWLTVVSMVALLAASIVGSGMVKQQFFPPSNTPMFYVDMWMPEGTDVRETIKQTEKVESYIRQQDNVEFVTTTVGQGMQRFALTYQPEKSYEAYAQLQVRTTDRDTIDGVELQWSEPLIQRRDRKRTLTVLADHDVLGDETPASLFARVKPKVEALDLPEGYSISWGGEYESSKDAQKSLFGSLPMGYLLMFIITMLLFNSVRKPLVIWFTVPLSIIGVSIGLLGTNMPFSFTAFLGLLSLSGMILKNGIVLLDQINSELATGKDPYLAVVDSAIIRVRPVSMAALTTILGMIPLVFDAFFGSMAITIMAGLGFATVLTLIVVPVMFAILYRIKPSTAGY
ncbi:efflux RND transporter permease subunit [Vibrio sp. IB15]|uniref:efflux RND transporter permease subunit n=1 Tax=Vibrio sp. IB15 TaxID=2779368 RepID=UPI0018E7771D|nr:efflux RND transporter permease subunit [Vibrio sp. IB15]MBJ2147294.1 efflux RND transporter permease subunit [Vibrio sp. IB15]